MPSPPATVAVTSLINFNDFFLCYFFSWNIGNSLKMRSSLCDVVFLSNQVRPTLNINCFREKRKLVESLTSVIRQMNSSEFSGLGPNTTTGSSPSTHGNSITSGTLPRHRAKSETYEESVQNQSADTLTEVWERRCVLLMNTTPMCQNLDSSPIPKRGREQAFTLCRN